MPLVDGMRTLANRVLSRFLVAAEGDKPKVKRMVMMIGPPAAGKGFFVGEADKDKAGETKKYKTDSGEEKETRTGWKLPKMTQGLFKDSDIPDRPDADESDNHLRAIQFDESRTHHSTLAAAHKEGKAAFDKAVADMWYETKDGERVGMAAAAKLSYDDFPENHKDFFAKTNKGFYVSMRGWHDDAKQKNTETGKPKERFKDQARHRFDDAIQHKTEADSDLLVVDSAGEDIDAQDFKGQIESAKQNGYEVSVIFLHPEQADTELSNLSRGKVSGKRMVDQADIDNWYKQNESALKEIQSAEPDNFLHYRKGPPDPDPKKATELRTRARDLMNRLDRMCSDATGKTAAACEEKEKALKEITDIVYTKSAYQLRKETSWAKTLPAADLPKKPEKNVAKAVAEMNGDAESRAGKKPKGDDAPKGDDEGKAKSNGKGEEKPKTRTEFLHEVGDKVVPNPNPDGRKDRIKVRSLPWEHQKKYYEQWSEKHAATMHRVASRYTNAIGLGLPNRVVSRYVNTGEGILIMADDKKGWLTGWMNRLASQIEKDLEVPGFKGKTSVKALGGPVVAVTIQGAEGDLKAMRDARTQLDKLLDTAIKSELKDYKGFKHTITGANKGEDLVLTCEVIFP